MGSLIPDFSKVPSLQLQLVKLQRQIEYYSRIIEYLGPLYEQQKFEEAIEEAARLYGSFFASSYRTAILLQKHFERAALAVGCRLSKVKNQEEENTTGLLQALKAG